MLNKKGKKIWILNMHLNIFEMDITLRTIIIFNKSNHIWQAILNKKL